MIEEQIPNEPAQEMSKPQWRIWLAAGGCAVLLCAGIFVGTLLFAGGDFVRQFIPASVRAAEEIPRTVTQSNTMGNPGAPVHIIEYGDFQCPYCLKFWSETEPQLIEEYVNTGKVYFEYRSMGAFLGPESAWAAEGAYCAGDQGKFWEYHDTLFVNWTGENVGDYTHDKLVKYAETLDLNLQEFESCLSEGKHKWTVEQDAAQAEAAGVRATPTFFINGVKVEGAQPFSILKQYIEDALNSKPNI
jgi:protein-disulfide isomerase